MIASSTPGRIRLRHPSLRDPQRSERLPLQVARWRHVREVRANPQAGSLIVRYDNEKLNDASLARRLESSITKLGATPLKLPAKPGGTTRVQANRWAKRGMLGSLAVSLVLAAAGQKRWHALSGGGFLASLAVHLWVHRRHILR